MTLDWVLSHRMVSYSDPPRREKVSCDVGAQDKATWELLPPLNLKAGRTLADHMKVESR